MGGTFAPHPGREPFIEPEIVPPRHRHQVPKPHVRHLMRKHFINILLRLAGGTFRIE